jgi:hypothetical protein
VRDAANQRARSPRNRSRSSRRDSVSARLPPPLTSLSSQLMGLCWLVFFYFLVDRARRESTTLSQAFFFFLISFFFLFQMAIKIPTLSCCFLGFLSLFFLPSFVFEYVETFILFFYFSSDGGKVIDFLFPLVGWWWNKFLFFYGIYVQQPTGCSSL